MKNNKWIFLLTLLLVSFSSTIFAQPNGWRVRDNKDERVFVKNTDRVRGKSIFTPRNERWNKHERHRIHRNDRRYYRHDNGKHKGWHKHKKWRKRPAHGHPHGRR